MGFSITYSDKFFRDTVSSESALGAEGLAWRRVVIFSIISIVELNLKMFLDALETEGVPTNQGKGTPIRTKYKIADGTVKYLLC